MKKYTKTAIAMALVAALGACKSKAPKSLPPEPTSTTTPYGYGEQGQGSESNGYGNDGGAANGGVGSQSHFENAVAGKNVILFDTDRYNIDSEDAAALQTQAQYLAQYPNLRVTIEGHCDERGTRDYNLALGERRANAAKNFLISLGISAGRINTVSYGKERPAALGSDEGSWAQNRRAVSVVIN